ncbi:energy-coupling factor ABC transporter ATP-binding protein [Vibrio sp.]|nr:energy-coupling factor ABC transporter ATP-binding protein [Vibrio sp.]
MITCNNVSLTKEGRDVLQNITVQLEARRIGIIGHNGSGKTTFTKMLNGLEKPTSGEVQVFDDQGKVLNNNENVGFVFQNPDNQIIFPIVEEDIAFGLQQSNVSKAEIAQKVDDILARFQLSSLKTRMTHQLSGGEKQLIAMMGVLVMQPEYIVLDEPTTLLDLKNRLNLINILKELDEKLIIVSHDLELMEQMDQVVLFNQGRIIEIGEPTTVIEKYKEISLC